jgi:pyridoxamine-phosphate oxidase
MKYFYKWFGDAVSVDASMPEKMTLSTVEIEDDGSIQPCSRVVLLKDVVFEDSFHSPYALIKGKDEPVRPTSEFFTGDTTDEKLLSQLHSRGGFLFVTNYESDKGKQLAKNPHCALNFLWPELERSVRVSGTAYRVPAALSDMYHEQRPRSSRVAALTSEQSRPVASRASLEERYTALDQQLRAAVPPEGRAADEYVPRPASWGAYVVVPHRMEVWQGRGGRFHERVQVQARAEGEPWEARCLQP